MGTQLATAEAVKRVSTKINMGNRTELIRLPEDVADLALREMGATYRDLPHPPKQDWYGYLIVLGRRVVAEARRISRSDGGPATRGKK
jgi:hypothetical protein